ncbi:MAG: radical SAM protein [Lachnospiraceae bacterium]|nr:radical SAM protein [Lachnospiraceae bacterium]
MHYTRVKGILSAKNGMNLYRGCSHGCIYCDSRSKCYQMNHDFEDIEVKENAVELLEKILKHKRKKCMIETGAMTDPYIPLEQELGYMRKCLELIDTYGFGINILTKSDRILRDLDLLIRIHKKTKCVVQMTMTTHDEELCQIIEPNVCTTKRRHEVLKVMQEYGIPTVVWMTPILPFINDTEENLNGILDYCVDAGVRGIMSFGIGMTLREGNREYFYKNLERSFPGIKEKYLAAYGNKYQIPCPNSGELTGLLRKRCKETGMMSNENEIFQYLSQFEEKQKAEQIHLFDFVQ